MQNIIISGNSYVSDLEIIEVASIKHYPPLFQIRSSDLKKKILTLDYVKDVSIRRNLIGQLFIEIEEEKPVFYNRDNAKFVFASGKEITTQDLQGFPVLINYVPNEIYERLIKEMEKTNTDVMKLISEIEYQPWVSDDVVIDDTRFFLRMNDGNSVYVNLINWEKLNNYMAIYSTLGTAHGFLQLDSSLGNGITFIPYS